MNVIYLYKYINHKLAICFKSAYDEYVCICDPCIYMWSMYESLVDGNLSV